MAAGEWARGRWGDCKEAPSEEHSLACALLVHVVFFGPSPTSALPPEIVIRPLSLAPAESLCHLKDSVRWAGWWDRPLARVPVGCWGLGRCGKVREVIAVAAPRLVLWEAEQLPCVFRILTAKSLFLFVCLLVCFLFVYF